MFHLKKLILYSPRFFEPPCILKDNFKLSTLTLSKTFVFNVFCNSRNKRDNELYSIVDSPCTDQPTFLQLLMDGKLGILIEDT